MASRKADGCDACRDYAGSDDGVNSVLAKDPNLIEVQGLGFC